MDTRVYCVKQELKSQKRKRAQLEESIKRHYPLAFQKADSIESLAPDEFAEIDKTIRLLERLLKIIQS